MSVYQMVKTAIEGILPDGWKFDAFEPLSELPDVTGVTLKIRTVSRLPAAPIGAYQVDWVLTITSPTASRESADPQLFDDLITFLGAIEDAEAWLSWTEATKTVGEDLERLAYDITIRTHTEKEA